MSTIQPSGLPVSSAQSAGMVLIPLTVTDAASAAALSVLDQGAVVDAQVQDKTTSGQVTVTTDQTGPLTLSAKGAAADLLAVGSKVVLQVITAADGQLALRVLAVDGQTLAKPITVASPTVSPELPMNSPQTTTAAAQPVLPQLPQPVGLVATVIRPAVLSAASGVGLPGQENAALPVAENLDPQTPLSKLDGGLPVNLPIGTTVTVRILDVNTPTAPASTPAMPTAKESLAADAAPAALHEEIANAPGTPAAAKPVLLNESLPDVPQFTPEPVPADKSALPVLEGKVVSTIPGQRVTVGTPIGVLSLPAVPALKNDAEVRFEILSRPELPQPDKSEEGGAGASPIRTLNDGLNTLMASGDTAALQKVMSVIPQLDGRLAASMAVVLKSLDRQSGRALLDEDEVEGLVTSGKKGVGGRVAGALNQLQDDVADYPGQDGGWRGFTVPLATGTQIEPVQFFIRHPPSDHEQVQPDGDDRGTGGTAKNRDQRFLVEIMLSRMGRFQMDGLVQRMDKRFDLIVRTQQPLSREMRNDITDLFITTTEAAGSRGSVMFQSGGRFVSVKPVGDHTTLSV